MSISTQQIEALKSEAATAGDDAMVRICTDALYAPSPKTKKLARQSCEGVIADAKAQR